PVCCGPGGRSRALPAAHPIPRQSQDQRTLRRCRKPAELAGSGARARCRHREDEMTFTAEQRKALEAPLDPKHVASRSQGGSQVSYIEGWHAIAEANRIFGFDGWTRETVDLRQLGEPYEVNGKFRVNYSARVRIVAGGIVREGCGFGQGIDRDVGQAHESALKEAET